MMTDLSHLNETQRAAVLHSEGPLMILAGAGSGKTRTLVTKISYLLDEKQIGPHRILALTFSNKAAREMRERIAKQVNVDLGALQITTFHSFCAKVLRNEASYLGLSRSFTIYDTSETKSVVKAILARHGISQKEVSPFEVMYFIDHLKNIGHQNDQPLPEELAGEELFFQFYKEYESEVARANAVDFGGLITGVITLFEKFPQVLETYQNRFQYLLVDEYQDTNKAQFKLLDMLSQKKKNICVVGDEDQSIYSWRGADISNILDFETTYQNATLLKLEQNYRSSKNIIEAASCVIEKNQMRKGKTMWTDNPDGDSIEVIEVSNEKKEAEFITNSINDLISEGTSLDDVAVFYRTNSQSRLIEDYLRRQNIPYRVVGGVKFYERKEIKDIIAYLRILVNPSDSLALGRIINVPARGVGATSLRKIENEAIRLDCSLWEAMEKVISNYEEDYKELRLSKNVRSSLSNFITLINDCRSLSDHKEKPSIILDKILSESGYVDFLKIKKDYESQARLENIDEFKNAVAQFEENVESATLINFLETITLDTSFEAEEESQIKGEVSLMTVHGAKGLEFSYVFISGAEENLFPSFKSVETGEYAIEEERRLFYVAMTRAMKKLYIIFAQGRMLFGSLKFNGPSRFILEIPDKYYHWKKEENEQQTSSWDDEFSQETNYYDDEKTYQVEGSYFTYPEGSKVNHAIYGEGLVLNASGRGSDEKVTIKFHDGTKKKFLVKFAPLSKIWD